MVSLNWSELWRGYVGGPESRRPVATLAAAELVVLTLGFLLGLDVLLPSPVPTLLFLGFVAVPALYAGWLSAGVATGIVGTWLPLAWDATVPPLVGYLVGSNAPRFVHPRLIGVEYTTPRAELTNGLEYAVFQMVLLAAIVGTLLYFAGRVTKVLQERYSV